MGKSWIRGMKKISKLYPSLDNSNDNSVIEVATKTSEETSFVTASADVQNTKALLSLKI